MERIFAYVSQHKPQAVMATAMTQHTDEYPWEGQCYDAAYEFGLRCANLVAWNPYKEAAPLDRLINTLMTELWDRNFSQGEIRAAFDRAVEDMPRYAAGAERRSGTSSVLSTADWRAARESAGEKH